MTSETAICRESLRRFSWIGLATGTVLFVALSLLVTAGATDRIDRDLLLSMRHATNPDLALGPEWLREAAAEWTALGGYPIMVLLCLVVLIGFALAQRRRIALFAFGALAGGAVASSALKALFERPRPDLVEHLDKIFTSSFPSAHAMMSTVVYLTLAALLTTVLQRRRVALFAFAVAGFCAVLIGISRVYLGVHWPSDVLAGWCIGLAWACGCWLVADRLRQSNAIEEPAEMPVGAPGTARV